MIDRAPRRDLNAAENAELARLFDNGTISQATRQWLQRGLDLEAGPGRDTTRFRNILLPGSAHERLPGRGLPPSPTGRKAGLTCHHSHAGHSNRPGTPRCDPDSVMTMLIAWPTSRDLSAHLLCRPLVPGQAGPTRARWSLETALIQVVIHGRQRVR